jgi:D-alanine-D-alanine ligase-like ATP-grasp enzyme/acylphosphatase
LRALKKRSRTNLKIIYFFLLCFLLNPKGRGLDPYHKSPFKHKFTQIVPGNKKSAVFLRVNGRVTGVNYRSWLKRKALVNGLECYLRNWRGKSVLALLIGPAEVIEQVVREAWKGPGRASVIKIHEKWFNKSVKSGYKHGKKNGEENIPWSQETANLLRNTIEYLGPIVKEPNFFHEEGRFHNMGEIERAAQSRNLFVSRISNINYLVAPDKSIGFQNSESSNVSSIVRLLTDHKQLTKDYLSQYGLPVPAGSIFSDFNHALDYLVSFKKPLVVKPAAGSYGKGITVDVRTEKDLVTAWHYAKKHHEQVVLEELIEGVDVRILVTGGKACAALMRVPANIVGDGKRTIDELIDLKNKERQKNPRLRKAPIIPDAYTESFLARQGYNFDSIPESGKVVFLHLKANLEAGGDSIGLMDFIHPDLLTLAEEAATAFGTFDYWGIDLLVERVDLPREKQRCCIIEVNARANIYNVQFPMYGKPADAAKALIDYLFPDVINDCDYPVVTKRVHISGIFNTDAKAWISEVSREHDLQGEFQTHKSSISAIITGRQKSILNFLDQLMDQESLQNCLIDGLLINDCGDAEQGSLKSDDRSDSEEIINVKQGLSLSAISHFSVNNFEGHEIFKAQDFAISTNLFLGELTNRGYIAEPFYEDLIKIEKDNLIGITGLRYSSSYADTACEKYYPARKLLIFHALPVSRGIRLKSRKINAAKKYYLKNRDRQHILTSLHPEELARTVIRREADLISFWRKAERKGTNHMLLEEFVKGNHVCIAVIKERAYGALIIEPASIIGDGLSSITELIDKKNMQRSKNPWYRDKLIGIDKRLINILKRSDLDADTVLDYNKKVYLESKIDLEFGGETTAINEIIHPDYYNKAVQAMSAFSGLEFACIHMIIPSPDQPAVSQKWVVLGVDTKPEIGMFHFPFRGKPINLAKIVVENLALTERARWIKERHGG